MELIANDSNEDIAEQLSELAAAHWNKDPYIIKSDFSIRARMISALVREAFYLVQNGYASIEDIDRACRNDAGYYLPFAGNFRYMDIMGTCAYGFVMNDLNPTLSKAKQIPGFFKDMISEHHFGMENNKGFYNYRDGEIEKWQKLFRGFSYEIQMVIKKYPFNNSETEAGTEIKQVANW